ncbi:MAG: hypothetical protein ACXIVQ_03015 [Acidimicrobiales bacterium]
MRFRTKGDIRRIDLSPALELIPALRDEWADLTFDRKGRLVNPLTGDTVDALVLQSGRHRESGAVYRLTVRTPEWDLPEDRKEEFHEELLAISEGPPSPDAWADYSARRQAASVQVGAIETHTRLTLRTDDLRVLAVDVTDESENWTVELTIEHGRTPRLHLAGRADLTAVLRELRTPGCLARRFGGSGEIVAAIDLGALERDARAITVDGHANRFGGSASVDVQTSAARWRISAGARIRTQGIARPVVWFFRRRIRRSLKAGLDEFWPTVDESVASLARDLHALRRVVDAEGGPNPFVHRVLWDDDFDPEALHAWI